MRFFEKAFHTVVIASFISFVSGIAHADNSYMTTGQLVDIKPIYTNVSSQQPYEQCGIRDVPVYGNTGGGASGGDVLAGMIIGGLLGKGVTGKDNGAAAGAVLGGVIAADKGQGGQRIIGYERQRVCETKYRNAQSQIVNQYRLIYDVDGHRMSYTVNRTVGESAYIGQRKRFRVRYQILN